MAGKFGNFASAAQQKGYAAEVADGDIKPKHPVHKKKKHHPHNVARAHALEQAQKKMKP